VSPATQDDRWSVAEESPERSAAILRERARALARPPIEAREAANALEIATFRLGDERYGIEAHYVLEVMRLEDTTLVPGLPDFFLGITNRRGEILAVVDLARFLGIVRGTERERSRLIVLGRTSAEFGIVADEVEEIVKVAEDALHPPSSVLGGAPRPYLRGVTRDALVVLDGAALLADERLFVDQREEPSLRPSARPN
jgi:purine-binding chemotaxis protein CheW